MPTKTRQATMKSKAYLSNMAMMPFSPTFLGFHGYTQKIQAKGHYKVSVYSEVPGFWDEGTTIYTYDSATMHWTMTGSMKWPFVGEKEWFFCRPEAVAKYIDVGFEIFLKHDDRSFGTSIIGHALNTIRESISRDQPRMLAAVKRYTDAPECRPDATSTKQDTAATDGRSDKKDFTYQLF